MCEFEEGLDTFDEFKEVEGADWLMQLFLQHGRNEVVKPQQEEV